MAEKKPKAERTVASDSVNKLFADLPKVPQVKKHGFKPNGCFDSAYRHEFPWKLVEHMSQGYSFYSFASEIGVVPTTLDKWLKKHDDFKTAKEVGEAHSLHFWEKAGIQGLHLGKNFNSIIWIFNMKNRFRKFGWRDKFAEDDAGGGVHIGTTVNVSVPELSALIAAARAQKQEIERENVIDIESGDSKALGSGFDRPVVPAEEPARRVRTAEEDEEPVL